MYTTKDFCFQHLPVQKPISLFLNKVNDWLQNRHGPMTGAYWLESINRLQVIHWLPLTILIIVKRTDFFYSPAAIYYMTTGMNEVSSFRLTLILVLESDYYFNSLYMW